MSGLECSSSPFRFDSSNRSRAEVVRQAAAPPITLSARSPAFFGQFRADVCAPYLGDAAVWQRIGFLGPSMDSGGRWRGAPSGETLPSIDPVTGVWTRDIRKAHQTAASLEAGTVGLICYNSLPRGGFKQNGWGREKGPYGLDLFTQIKSVIIHFT